MIGCIICLTVLTGVCSFDIMKCFDTINHAIIINKFEFYGFEYDDIKWFKSYVHKRKQLVYCHNQYCLKNVK